MAVVYENNYPICSDDYKSISEMDDELSEEKYPDYSEELGLEIAKNLGSPGAMGRMTGYLCHVKPKKAEMIVDEMLAICSEADTWKEKRANEEANAKYNGILYYGLGGDKE